MKNLTEEMNRSREKHRESRAEEKAYKPIKKQKKNATGMPEWNMLYNNNLKLS